jgi:hypothetical protein
LRQLKRDVRIPAGLLNDGGGEVFFEVLPKAIGPQIERVKGESTTEHPALPEVVGQTDSRLEVIRVAFVQRSARVQQRTEPSTHSLPCRSSLCPSCRGLPRGEPVPRAQQGEAGEPSAAVFTLVTGEKIESMAMTPIG